MNPSTNSTPNPISTAAAPDTPTPMNYAGFWPRLAATLMDSLIFVPIFLLLIWSSSDSRSVSVYLVAIPILNLIFPAYLIYSTGRWGQTYGKYLCDIKVVATDGSDIGYRHSFLRYSVHLGFTVIKSILGTLIFTVPESIQWEETVQIFYSAWGFIEIVVFFTNSKRRAAHDFIAGTVVVRLPAPAAQSGS